MIVSKQKSKESQIKSSRFIIQHLLLLPEAVLQSWLPPYFPFSNQLKITTSNSFIKAEGCLAWRSLIWLKKQIYLPSPQNRNSSWIQIFFPQTDPSQGVGKSFYKHNLLSKINFCVHYCLNPHLNILKNSINVQRCL